MSLTETRIVDGYAYSYEAAVGHISAQIYAPNAMRKEWALCFASCDGVFRELQGKYERHATKREALASIQARLPIEA